MTAKKQRNEEGAIGLSSGPDIRTGFIKQIRMEAYKPVVYSAVDGQAVFEGCIILGTVDEMEALTESLRQVDGREGVGITGERFRWPGAKVPFTIDAALPQKERVTKPFVIGRKRRSFASLLASGRIETSLRFVRAAAAHRSSVCAAGNSSSTWRAPVRSAM